MFKDKFFFFKIVISIIIACHLTNHAVNHQEKLKELTITQDETKTEDFLSTLEQKDLEKIKKEIDLLNNPPAPEPEPEPTPPPQNNYNPPTPPTGSRAIFQRNKAMMIGSSFVEGMTAYGVLSDTNAIWERGIRIDNMTPQLNKAIAYQPNILILVYGTNDILNWGSNVTGFINAYRNKLQQIKASLPQTKIYICSILPVSSAAINEKPALQYINLYNQELQKLANESNVTFLDSSYILTQEAAPYEFDGIHPKGFFYPKWAADIINKIGMR